MRRRERSLEQAQRQPFASIDLIDRALARSFVRPEAKEVRSVAEAFVGKVIVFHFDDEASLQRFPFVRASRAPAARSARGAPGKARLAFQRDDDVGDFLAIRSREARRETDMVAILSRQRGPTGASRPVFYRSRSENLRRRNRPSADV
jgi:hypothetical protein